MGQPLRNVECVCPSCASRLHDLLDRISLADSFFDLMVDAGLPVRSAQFRRQPSCFFFRLLLVLNENNPDPFRSLLSVHAATTGFWQASSLRNRAIAFFWFLNAKFFCFLPRISSHFSRAANTPCSLFQSASVFSSTGPFVFLRSDNFPLCVPREESPFAEGVLISGHFLLVVRSPDRRRRLTPLIKPLGGFRSPPNMAVSSPRLC